MSIQSQELLWNAQISAGDIIEEAILDGVSIKRICNQAVKIERDKVYGMSSTGKLVLGAKILAVANRYDEITSMKLNQSNNDSEVKAIKEFIDHPEIYDPQVVNALLKSIKILYPGISVELHTVEQALVLSENSNDILRPMLLSFRDNSIVDLTHPVNHDIYIVDIMKTLDNRNIIDLESITNL